MARTISALLIDSRWRLDATITPPLMGPCPNTFVMIPESRLCSRIQAPVKPLMTFVHRLWRDLTASCRFWRTAEGLESIGPQASGAIEVRG